MWATHHLIAYPTLCTGKTEAIKLRTSALVQGGSGGKRQTRQTRHKRQAPITAKAATPIGVEFMVNHKTYLHMFRTQCVVCSKTFEAQGFVDVENGPSVHDSDAAMACPACEDAAHDEHAAWVASLAKAELLIARIDRAQDDPRCTEQYVDRLYDKMSEWEIHPIDHAAMTEALRRYEASTGKKI